MIFSMGNDLFESLPALFEHGLGCVIGAVEKPCDPALPSKLGRHIDHEPCFSEAACAMDQAPCQDALRIRAPAQQGLAHAGHVRISNGGEFCLEKFGGPDASNPRRELLLFRINQDLAVDATVNFMFWNTRWDRDAVPNLEQWSQDAV